MAAVSPSPQARFDELVRTFYDAWFRFHPETAVEVGEMAFADRLTPYDEDDHGALLALNEKLLVALEEIDPATLDPDRVIDRRLLMGQARAEHRELLERDWRRRDPVRFLPLDAVHQLTEVPVPDFARCFEARVSQIPAHLRGARAHLLEMPELVPEVWLQSALASAASGAAYLRALEAHPKVRQAFPKRPLIHRLLEEAARAVEAWGRFLETEVAPLARGRFACGRAHFDALLAERHGLDLDADALHAFGSRLFRQTEEALRAHLRDWLGHGDMAAANARLGADHPEPAQLLAAYREGMQRARAFVAARDLVTLPEPEVLEVVETPPFLRHQIPFAAYQPPVPSDPAQRGLYYVTPPEGEAALAEHNRTALAHTCVHEAYPGHHLQFVTANRTPAAASLPRLVNASATLYEGWALYCEQLMVEQGFLDRPEHWFVLLRDRLWRALRVQLDVELHTRDLELEAAAERMQQALGFPRAQALADLAWYTRSPTVPLGYATGWALILAARELRLAAGDGLRAFHDRLLSCGSIGLPLVLERAFGADCWQQARERVFS